MGNSIYQKEHIRSFTKSEAIAEASRCLLCHDAPCSKGCPANTNPASFIRSIRFENFAGAAKTIREANILGAVCSRVCPHNDLCEKECNRKKIDKPIEIGLLQRFATEYEEKHKLEILQKGTEKEKKIAVIGSGPAGLSAAAKLSTLGYQVTVFEKNKVSGGILSTGIVLARLPHEIVAKEIERIKKLGVTFENDCEVGKDITIDELKKEGFEAFLITTGYTQSKKIGIDNADTKGIYGALDYLAIARVQNCNVAEDKKVVVIGGGDVAIDAALTSVLQGAKKTTILYRRRLQDMPATIESLEIARDLRVDIFTTFTPMKYIQKDGLLTGIKANGTYDNSEITLDADIIVEAIGQSPYNVEKIFPKIDLKDNKIVANEGRTNLEGVFAAGDIVNGGNTVAQAVKEGKIAAESIDKYLNKEKSAIFNIGKAKKDRLLEIEFCGVKCENPFFLSSSPVGHSYDMCSKAYKTGWGGIVYKTIVKFVCNECSPRFDNISKENTPFIGFKNMEQLSERHYEEDFEDIVKLKRDFPNKVLVASIMGQNHKEWTELAKLAEQAGADMIECNFSCPQVTMHGLGSDIGQDPLLVKEYTNSTRRGTRLPILAKMTPNIGNMEIPAIAAIEGGTTGIAAINTIKSITAIDIDKFVCLPIVNGKSSISGYSGKAIKPIALRFITQMKQHPKLKNVPISGMGGIETWQDALEFLLVGATNLQATTSIMQYGYRIVEDMKDGLAYYLKQKKFDSIRDIVGLALNNIVPAENLDRDFKIIPDINYDKCIGCGRCYISCYDAAHQAIDWNEERKQPKVNDNCVGCHLCINVCPVSGCITSGEVKFKEGAKKRNIIV